MLDPLSRLSSTIRTSGRALAWLQSLVATLLTLRGAGGVNVVLKVPALIAGGTNGASMVLLRADSAFYGHDTPSPPPGARFSVTAPRDPDRPGRDQPHPRPRLDHYPLHQRSAEVTHRRTFGLRDSRGPQRRVCEGPLVSICPWHWR